jgi:hypothetical protein
VIHTRALIFLTLAACATSSADTDTDRDEEASAAAVTKDVQDATTTANSILERLRAVVAAKQQVTDGPLVLDVREPPGLATEPSESAEASESAEEVEAAAESAEEVVDAAEDALPVDIDTDAMESPPEGEDLIIP